MITDDDAVIAMQIVLKYCLNNKNCKNTCILRKRNKDLCPIRTQGQEWNEEIKLLELEAIKLRKKLTEDNKKVPIKSKIWCLNMKKAIK